MSSKQAVAYRQQRIVTTSTAALATRSHNSICQQCRRNGLLNEWDMCQLCSLDISDECAWCKKPLDGEVCIGNPNAAREVVVHKACFDESVRLAHGSREACVDCGAEESLTDRGQCAGCRPTTAEERYDSDAEAGADDWKGDEGR